MNETIEQEWNPTEEEIQEWIKSLNDYEARDWMEAEVW